MIDILLDWDCSEVQVKAVTPLGIEILRSLIGSSERSLAWGEAKPLLRSLERATELHNVRIGGSIPC